MNTEVMRSLNQRPIVYYPIYRKITGSIKGGILLSQLMYWFKVKDKIYKTNDEFMEETSLTDHEMREAKKIIKNLPFITVTREGIPAKTFYSIDWHKYSEFLKDFCSTQDRRKPTNKKDKESTNQFVENPRSITENTTETTFTEKCLSKDKQAVQKTAKRKRRRKKKVNIENKQNNFDTKKETSSLDKFSDILSEPTRTVLLHWKSKGGKIPINRTKDNKFVHTQENYVTELLLDGLNPYYKLVDNQELKSKQWTVEEIISCINYFVDNLKKDISKLYFSDFVANVTAVRTKDKTFRFSKNFSTLADIFEQLDFLPTKESEKLKNTFQGNKQIPETIFIQSAGKIIELNKKFAVSDVACSSFHRNLLNVFIAYVKEKLNNIKFDVKYICGDGFIEEFKTTMLSRKIIEKKKGNMQ